MAGRDHALWWVATDKDKGPCRSLLQAGKNPGLGGGLKRQQGVWCCLKGISGFIDPIPPHSIPRRVPKYQGFCIVRSCRVR